MTPLLQKPSSAVYRDGVWESGSLGGFALSNLITPSLRHSGFSTTRTRQSSPP